MTSHHHSNRECPCGHSKGHQEHKSLLANLGATNRFPLELKTTLVGSNTPINSCNVEDFSAQSTRVASFYNGADISAIYTKEGDDLHMIANINFNGKTVQFVAVDGSSYSQGRDAMTIEPGQIIDDVNSGKLKPIRLAGGRANTQLEKTNVDGYAGGQWYCQLLSEVYNRVGIFDKDEWVFLSVLNLKMANAYWNGYYMSYGDGGGQMNALTSIEIVGHEASHGIVQALGELQYEGDSGALNESIADIFGATLEKYFDVKNNRNRFDWTMAEDVLSDGQFMRSFSNPNIKGQPDTYRGKFWMKATEEPKASNDNNGVHINSGVLNYWFYVLVNAKSGTNDFGTKFNVQVPWDIFRASRLIYLTMAALHNDQATYPEFAAVLRKTAAEITRDSRQVRSVDQALTAVGLRTPERTFSGFAGAANGDDSSGDVHVYVHLPHGGSNQNIHVHIVAAE